MLQISIHLRHEIHTQRPPGPRSASHSRYRYFLRAGNDFADSVAFSAADKAFSAATYASVAELAAAICAFFSDYGRRTDEEIKEVGDTSRLSLHPCPSRCS